MQKSQIDSVTLIVAALAAALALTQVSGSLAWMSSIGGIILLIILFAFDQEGHRTLLQSLAFSAVCGFAAAVASGVIYQILANHGEVHLANGEWATFYLPITCVFATAIFWAIDVMRMNARKAAPIHVPRALGDTSLLGTSAPPIYQTPAAPMAAAQPVSTEPRRSAEFGAPVVPPPVQPVYQQAQPYPMPVMASTPVSTPPPPPPPVRELPTATSLFTIPAPPPAPEPQPLASGPAPIIPRSGKETMIYVSLLNEGLNVMRSVRAEALGRDYYRIIDEMPEGETWQFQPGQVVRCKKKNLSTGKAMVAMEEAQRAT